MTTGRITGPNVKFIIIVNRRTWQEPDQMCVAESPLHDLCLIPSATLRKNAASL